MEDRIIHLGAIRLDCLEAAMMRPASRRVSQVSVRSLDANLGFNAIPTRSGVELSMPTASAFTVSQFGNQLRSPLTFPLNSTYHLR